MRACMRTCVRCVYERRGEVFVCLRSERGNGMRSECWVMRVVSCLRTLLSLPLFTVRTRCFDHLLMLWNG